MGRSVADRQRRTDEVFFFKEERPAANVFYYGRTDDFTALDSQAVWQIKRISRLGSVVTTEYANYGKYTCIWADRATYFAPVGAGPAVVAPVGSYPSGLSIAGRVTIVTIDDVSWTPLPAVALANRNAICILNTAANPLKVNYDPLIAGWVGVPVAVDNQRFYDITDAIPIYAKAAPGAGVIDITIEELS